MSTVSENQNMAQPNQQDNSYDLSATSAKRKRGRPRKDGRPRKEASSGSEPNKRRKQWTALPSSSSSDGLVGQEVSCSFIGVFDAGYLLNVRVGGSGPILTGLVFDPRLSVPISAENDVAPHLPMLRRNDSSQAGAAQDAGIMQHIRAKESPTTSSFTSHEQADLQPDTMEVTPSETMETLNIRKTLKVFVDGPAAETSGRLASSHHPQSQAESDVSMEAPASKPSNGCSPSVLEEAIVPNASAEPLSIPKEAPPATTEPSVEVLQNQTLKIGDFLSTNLSLELSSRGAEEPSEDHQEVDESVGGGGGGGGNRGGAASSGLEQE